MNERPIQDTWVDRISAPMRVHAINGASAIVMNGHQLATVVTCDRSMIERLADATARGMGRGFTITSDGTATADVVLTEDEAADLAALYERIANRVAGA